MSENIIFEYNWQDAVDDGVFVDVSPKARRMGVSYPLALSQGVHGTFLEGHPEERGRDIALFMLLNAFKGGALKAEGSRFEFQYRDLKGEEHTICAVCGPKGSKDPSPCITLFFPHED